MLPTVTLFPTAFKSHSQHFSRVFAQLTEREPGMVKLPLSMYIWSHYQSEIIIGDAFILGRGDAGCEPDLSLPFISCWAGRRTLVFELHLRARDLARLSLTLHANSWWCSAHGTNFISRLLCWILYRACAKCTYAYLMHFSELCGETPCVARFACQTEYIMKNICK